MIKYLDNIREPNKNYNKNRAFIISICIFALGITLGILSKSLDNLALDSSIWWHKIIGYFDFGNVLSSIGIWLLIALTISVYSKTPVRAMINVFLFFIGMNVSYHLWTIYYSGFNPESYMRIWYSLTILSPFLAFICWYSKGDHIVSIIISSLIIGVMIPFCFSVGQFYIYYKSFIDAIIFILTLLVLHKNIKNSCISLLAGFLLSFMFSQFIHF